MNVDVTALDLLPETQPVGLPGAEQGLQRCWVTCFITCWDTCNNTEILH